MKTTHIHTPSLLIGILIGIVALVILLLALPAQQVRHSSLAPLETRFNQVAVQLKGDWNHFMAGINSHGSSSITSRSCLQVRTWLNQLVLKLVDFLDQHGFHLTAWQLSTGVCTSGSIFHG